jgi:hypothetical protein
MTRIWNDAERENQSRLILERKPYLLSTGPRGKLGKDRVRRNSIKHGYFTESHREFRKGKRSPQARKIEKLIRELLKAKDDNFKLNLIDQITKRLDEYCSEMTPTAILEGTYLNSLVLAAVNKCIYIRVQEIISNIRENSQDIKTA